MNSLRQIREVKSGNKAVLREQKWLSYLSLTREQNVNLEQVVSLEKMVANPVLRYVEKTLEVLGGLDIDLFEKEVIEEVLIWSEVAKCGLPHTRKEWTERGYQIAIHNIGSAQIYASEKAKLSYAKRDLFKEELVYNLILIHGAVGQFIRGEVQYRQFAPLIKWIKDFEDAGLISFDIETLLYSLNQCVIQGVSETLWEDIHSEVREVIDLVVKGEGHNELDLFTRLKKLRKSSILRGEDFNEQMADLFANDRLKKLFFSYFRKIDLWYVESALQEFSLEEFIKIFLLIFRNSDPLSLQQVSFEPFMKDMHYDYKGKKTINLYKKRIIESYLKELTIEGLLGEYILPNEHVGISVASLDSRSQIVGVKFSYSKAGEKLIEFCQEAEKSALYERSIVLLYDFFGFRKDSFDRLQNEENYLSEMNSGENHKKVISNYATGDTMLDIGAGGGVMLDVLSEDHPGATVTGIDLSTNVIEDLRRRKKRQNKRWNVMQADALKLSSYIEKGSVDTIVFSSILHEMYSYIPYKGDKFNLEVISDALKSAFSVLKPGGRIIIRDGIMTEPVEQERILEFHDPNGMAFFKRYVQDFKGRAIQYLELSSNRIKVPVNDAMEFLYTYTWGEESYPHEVQEQFGYLTPTSYKEVIQSALGQEAKVLKFEHYLQEGYADFILPKVSIFDDRGHETDLPDSTCFIVIEKSFEC